MSEKSLQTGDAMPDPPPETLECRICGAKSRWTDGFTSMSNPFRKPHHVCVTCRAYRKKYRDYYISFTWWTAFAIVMGYQLTGSSLEAVLFASGVYLSLYLAIVLHEIGHVAAAYAVGADVPVVSFGGGLRAKVVKMRNLFVVFSPTPTEGLMIPVHSTNRNYRMKACMISLAGPVVNLLAALGGMAILISGGEDLSEYTHGAVLIWTVTNLFLGIENLFSFSRKTALGTQQSDGARIWNIWSKSDEEIRKLLQFQKLIVASLEFHLGDKEKALTLVEREIDQGNDSFQARMLMTAALADTGRLNRGIELGRKYLEDDGTGLMERALFQNNLAFTLFQTGDESDLHEADRLSAQAIETLPMILAIKSTRGSILIATGRYEEGLSLLDDKRFKLEKRGHRASVKAMQAVGLASLGNRDRASRLLSAARSLDPANRQLRTAEAALATIDA